MIAANYGPVADIEIVWTIIALVGLIYSLFNVKDANGDLKVLREAGVGNGRLTLAKYQMQAESLRTAIQAVFLSIGLAAMALPSAPDNLDLPLRQIVIQVLVTYGLIISSVLLTIKSYLGYRVRRVLTQPSDGSGYPLEGGSHHEVGLQDN